MTNCSNPLILIKSTRVCLVICHMIGSHCTSLTKSVSKMLVESLVLCRMRYVISVCGPALQQRYISCLQPIQNRGVQLSCNLKKYDPACFFPLIISDKKIDTFLYAYHQCRYQTCLKLNPPIQFGSKHSYSTRTNRHYANITRFSTAFGQKRFVIRAPPGGMLYHLIFIKFLYILQL